VEDAAAGTQLLKALPDLAAGNRAFAVAGLTRTPARANALLDAVQTGACKAEWLNAQHRDALRKHPDSEVRKRSEKVLGP
jgi:hypothetical protein